MADHFAETSQKLHDLTLQYRSVYDHLAAGAGELCPESLEKLDGGLGLDALPDGAPALETDELTLEPEPSPDDAETAPERDAAPAG